MIFFLFISISVLLYIPDSTSGNDENVSWTTFLDQLYCLLSSYSFQKDKSKFNVNDLEDWGRRSTNTGIDISNSNLQRFLNIMSDHNLHYPHQELSEDQIDSLNRILEITLSNASQIVCIENEVVIQGFFVKASDIPEELNSYCNHDVKKISIFAVDTIFIDKSLDFRGKSLVSVMAQKWFVSTKSTIDVSGYKNSKFFDSSSQHASDGGDFLGLGDIFENGEKLEIAARGEDGFENKFYSNLPEGQLMQATCDLFERNAISSNGGNGGSVGMIFLNRQSRIKIATEGGDGGSVSTTIYNAGSPFYCGRYEKGKGGTPSSQNIKNGQEIINRYKALLYKTYLEYPILSRSIPAFIAKINVRHATTLDDLIEEFKEIERGSLNLFNKGDVLPLLKNLMAKILEASKSASREAKKGFLFFYTTILSYVCRVEENSEFLFIVNLREYADSIKDDIKNVKLGKERSIIDNSLNSYVKNLNEKIQQSENLISGHILPKIETKLLDVDNKLTSLEHEIDELIVDIKGNEKALQLRKKDLEAALIGRAVLGTLASVGGLLAFCGPIAAVGALAVEITAEIAITALDVDADVGYDSSKFSFKEISDNCLKVMESGWRTCSKRKRRDLTEKLKKKLEDAPDIIGHTRDELRLVKDRLEADEERMQLIDENLETIHNQIENLDRMHDEVCATFRPVWLRVAGDIRNLKNAKSESQMSVEKWNIESTLKKVKGALENFYTGLSNSEELSQIITEIFDAINVLVKIFESIQNYEQQKNLGRFIAEIHSAKFAAIPVRDPILRKYIQELDLKLKSNILLMEYKKFSDAVKQHTFPLADVYFKQFRVPLELQLNKSISALAEDVSEKITDVSDKLAKVASTIVRFDELKFPNVTFGIDKSSRIPAFFTWTNKQHGNEISNLLKGHQTILSANPCSHMRNAIKFKTVKLRFKSVDPKLKQTFVDRILKDTPVMMQHSGNSYYRCDQKTYVISSQSINITFTYNAVGNPRELNTVYEKLKNGDAILSPFTTWIVKLNIRKPRIKQLLGKVDLELIGMGQYFQAGEGGLCVQNLEDYYKREEVDVCTNKFESTERYVLGNRKCYIPEHSMVKLDEAGNVAVYNAP